MLSDPRKPLGQCKRDDLLKQGTAFYNDPERSLGTPFESPGTQTIVKSKLLGGNLQHNGVIFEHYVTEDELRAEGLSDRYIQELRKYANDRGVDMGEIPSSPYKYPESHKSQWNRSDSPADKSNRYKKRVREIAESRQQYGWGQTKSGYGYDATEAGERKYYGMTQEEYEAYVEVDDDPAKWNTNQ